MGRFPIKARHIRFWSTAGLAYTSTRFLDEDFDGESDDLTDMALNDLYVILGGGADIYLGDHFFITFFTLFHWNVTPVTVKDYELQANETFSWYRISAYLGSGWAF
jgi:hypothetical protein